MNRSQVDPVFRGIPARTAGDDQMIAGLERLGGKTGLLETRRVGPFGGKLLLPVLVHDEQVEPRVGILELEGDDVAFDGNLLVLEIVGRKRMMS
jgi:hypothetical protein